MRIQSGCVVAVGTAGGAVEVGTAVEMVPKRPEEIDSGSRIPEGLRPGIGVVVRAGLRGVMVEKI
jgi:hypothetical protein